MFILLMAELVGTRVLLALNKIGEFFLFGVRACRVFMKEKLYRKELIHQMKVIGVDSWGIVLLTGSFAGLALALQSYIGFKRVGVEHYTGLVATIGMARELGPVLTGLMITGRIGSSIAAEIGSMKITEQIDALHTLCIDPFYYLIVPRILAALVIMPIITIFSMLFGMVSSYVLCIYGLSINAESYMSIIQENMELNDITGGLIKAAFFGLLFSWVACFTGYTTYGGARGVGKATTDAVVYGSIMILIGNFILTSFLYNTGIS
jgi:phospholipid/cholesterol/gamma-HCH transport system permease protein